MNKKPPKFKVGDFLIRKDSLNQRSVRKVLAVNSTGYMIQYSNSDKRPFEKKFVEDNFIQNTPAAKVLYGKKD